MPHHSLFWRLHYIRLNYAMPVESHRARLDRNVMWHHGVFWRLHCVILNHTMIGWIAMLCGITVPSWRLDC